MRTRRVCPHHDHPLISCSTVIIKAYSDCKLLVVQFSLLNGSIHDSWLQQGHEGMPMNDEIRGKCEVLACSKQFTAEPHRKKPDRASEVNSLKTVPSMCPLLLCLTSLVHFYPLMQSNSECGCCDHNAFTTSTEVLPHRQKVQCKYTTGQDHWTLTWLGVHARTLCKGLQSHQVLHSCGAVCSTAPC